MGRAGAFISKLVPVLSVLLIGYPLSRATVRTMLIGWLLIVVAITQFILRHYFQRTAPDMSTADEPGRRSLSD